MPFLTRRQVVSCYDFVLQRLWSIRGHVRRRDFITLLGGTLAAWPIAARAQQASHMRRVGVLVNGDPSNEASQRFLAALSDALRDKGWSNGRNLRVEIRWSGGDVKLMRSYAEELVGIDSEVMVCVSTANLDALRRVTRTIPIVFLQVSDPVAQGYVQNLARPGGNLTGFSAFEISTGGKWLDLAQADRSRRFARRHYLQS